MDLPELEDDTGIVDLFAALANSDRLGIVTKLWQDRLRGGSGLTVSDVAATMDLSRFSASHHLNLLRDVGVVDSHREQNRSVSVLRVEPLMRIWDWIDRIDESIDALEAPALPQPSIR